MSWGPRSVWGGRAGQSGREGGIAETTERLRQLVDGIEGAVAAADDLELSRYLAPPALGTLLAETAAHRAGRAAWLPRRTGLRWGPSRRPSPGPGRFWLRVRFEDLTEVRLADGELTAPGSSHELELELETTGRPWRLCRAEEVFPD